MKKQSVIADEIFETLCNKVIGEGISRKVYSSLLLPDCVIKIEGGGDSSFQDGIFQNVMEWLTWERVRDTAYQKWFAPCVSISSGGSVLVMKKTKPALKFPKELPSFLGDTHRENYGMLKGKFVCHDYGWDTIFTNGLKGKKRKVEWYE